MFNYLFVIHSIFTSLIALALQRDRNPELIEPETHFTWIIRDAKNELLPTITDIQSAYKPGHSTETALVRVKNDIFTSIDQHGIVILILLDLSAAFDTIDHDVLFSRMESTLDITGPAPEWFLSYLGGRTLRVQIDDSFSIKPINHCVVDIGVAKLENCLTNIYTWMSQLKIN